MRAAIILLVVACRSHHAAPPPPPPPPPPAPVAGPSLYELAMPLTAADGKTIALDTDRGHPTLISMFYSSCTAACPLMINTVKRTLDQVPASKRDDIRVLLVSFDPARDTPARLHELANMHHLDGRWTLAAASDDDARTLAAVLGIRYRAVEGGQFFHTSAILVLDRDGRTAARMDGLGDPSALVAALGE